MSQNEKANLTMAARQARGEAMVRALTKGADQPTLEGLKKEFPFLADAVAGFALGEVWAESALDHRTRQLATVAAFAALGVFAGGCDLAAATAVLAAESHAVDVFELISTLAGVGLVILDDSQDAYAVVAVTGRDRDRAGIEDLVIRTAQSMKAVEPQEPGADESEPAAD